MLNQRFVRNHTPTFLLGIVFAAGLGVFSFSARATVSDSTSVRTSQSRHLAAGPVLGHVTTNSAKYWLMVRRTEEITVRLAASGSSESIQVKEFRTDTMLQHGKYHLLKSEWKDLDPSTRYVITIELDGEAAAEQSFQTFPAEPVFDVSFLTGSCAMRPPQAFRMFYPGPQEAIYPVMSAMPADFMMWLGDNVYYLFRHMGVPEQMYERRIRKAQVPEVDAFMRSRPMYAIWDDHDYGPDNKKGNFALKDTSWFIHTHFWANPYNGIPGTKGTFSHFQLSDADFFLTDNRFQSTTYRDPNPAMLGKGQMEWLKRGLLESTATFHFIVIGSQVLNRLDRGESWYHYPAERQELLDFLSDNNIKNVIFLTGDRHHTELQSITLRSGHSVYDFTCSPLTSVVNQTILGGPEENNPQRIPGTLVLQHNFGRVSLSGTPGQRSCLLEVFDERGDRLWDYRIRQQP